VTERCDVLVVGAGAAGIFAAWRAATLGAKVIVLEKTPRIGTKILVSGGGKCNIAHAGPLEEVLRAFRPEEARFLRPACYRLRNDQIVEHFTSRGLEVYTREDGRVFPRHATAKDVVAILERDLAEAGVEVRRDSPVQELLIADGRAVGARYARARRSAAAVSSGAERVGYRPATAKNLLRELGPASEAPVEGKGEIRARAVVVCPGGSSYPNSGTTGDGFEWARALGHTVQPVRAALAPIYLDLTPEEAERSGVALRDVVLKARQGKEFARWRGDLLFTHLGVSGPTALGISRMVDERLRGGDVHLEADLAPDLTFETLATGMIADAAAHPRRMIGTHLADWLPERLRDGFLQQARIEPKTPLGRIDRKARNRLLEARKAWILGKVRHVPVEKGEVVAGGISLDEVDPQTMASRRIEGLFPCGEVLDIAGPVGGYNLQAAFATGYVAGESAALILD
jgi:predicted flavoprotein YhiN